MASKEVRIIFRNIGQKILQIRHTGKNVVGVMHPYTMVTIPVGRPDIFIAFNADDGTIVFDAGELQS